MSGLRKAHPLEKAFFDYDPRGKATLAYEQLAREVLTLGRKKELGRGGFAPTR